MIKVMAVGNVTKDLEVRSGTTKKEGEDKTYKVAKFTVASNRISEDKTDYVDVEVWNGQAENCAKYLKKGSGVAVSGDLTFEEFTVNDEKRFKAVIKNAEIQFTDKKAG